MDKRHEEFFEVMDSDVYCTFRGGIARCIKGGKKNMLYGKSVNLNELYNRMIDDVIEYVQSEGFWDKEKDVNNNIVNKVNGYSVSKYGVTIEWIYKKLKGWLEDVNYNLTTDLLFEMMIERVGGVDNIEWNRLYDTIQFCTRNESILKYIGKMTISNNLYGYFVNRHKLKVVGVKNKIIKKCKGLETRLCRNLILNWEYKGEIREKYLDLSKLLRNKRDWWTYSTKGSSGNNGRSRSEICNYDILLGGRREDEVLPERCPIDRNIVLNYTGIDFSCGRFNLDECKSNSGEMETWSMASVDRIDSQCNYTYDNVEIISYYYNTLKGCANFDQLSKLYHYQKNRNSFI